MSILLNFLYMLTFLQKEDIYITTYHTKKLY